MSITQNLRQSAGFRWALTTLWSLLTVVLFLTPSGDGTPVTFVSQLFGGTTITDAIGHVIINGVLALFWFWTSSLYLEKPVKLIFGIGIVWAIISELLQLYIPGRGGSLLDMGANASGIIVGIWLYSKLSTTLGDADNDA